VTATTLGIGNTDVTTWRSGSILYKGIQDGTGHIMVMRDRVVDPVWCNGHSV